TDRVSKCFNNTCILLTASVEYVFAEVALFETSSYCSANFLSRFGVSLFSNFILSVSLYGEQSSRLNVVDGLNAKMLVRLSYAKARSLSRTCYFLSNRKLTTVLFRF